MKEYYFIERSWFMIVQINYLIKFVYYPYKNIIFFHKNFYVPFIYKDMFELKKKQQYFAPTTTKIYDHIL